MKDGQKAIYFLAGPSRKAIESGPYLEAFKARSLEVIYCLEPIDDFVMQHLRQFKDKDMVSADQDDLDLGDATQEAEGEELPQEQLGQAPRGQPRPRPQRRQDDDLAHAPHDEGHRPEPRRGRRQGDAHRRQP
jgi:hypothetical protein